MTLNDYSTDLTITLTPPNDPSTQAPAQSGSLRTSNVRVFDMCRENEFRQYQRMSVHRRFPYLLTLVIRVDTLVCMLPGFVLDFVSLGTVPISSADADG